MALPKKRHSTQRKGRRRAAVVKNFMHKYNIPRHVKQNQKNSDNSAGQ